MELITRFKLWDEKAMLAARRIQRKAPTYFFYWLSATGYGEAWTIAALLLILAQRWNYMLLPEQGNFLRAMQVAFVAWLIGHLLKKSVRRRRPIDAIMGYVPAVRTPGNTSFPSNHAATSMAFFLLLVLRDHPTAPWVGVWAVLIAFSRYYLGVHFVSDILGGWMLGLLCAIGFYLKLP